MIIGRGFPFWPRYVQFIDSEYFVPSLKMFPTSMPRFIRSGLPVTGHGSPSLTVAMSTTSAPAVFVFMHFPVWEPERVKPAAYDSWRQTLHPLFRASRVRAVFGGHYHAYGPSREFDGIRYFITGGGGAELRPEYRKAGGDYH